VDKSDREVVDYRLSLFAGRTLVVHGQRCGLFPCRCSQAVQRM